MVDVSKCIAGPVATVANAASRVQRRGFVCEHCRQRVADDFYRGPHGHRVRIGRIEYHTWRICAECFFDAHIPSGYQARELYVDGRATRRPALGIDWLDQRHWTITETVRVVRARIMGCRW